MTTQRQIAADIARLSSIYATLSNPSVQDSTQGLVVYRKTATREMSKQLEAIIANLVDLIPEQSVVFEEAQQ